MGIFLAILTGFSWVFPFATPTIVQEVREWATANGTSLNKYLRDCLEAKVNE